MTDWTLGRLHVHPVAEEQAPPFAQWVVLELMGHRRLAGFLTEQEIAGKGFLRLEVPAVADQPPATQLYNPASVYCITPTTQELAQAVAAGSRPAPVNRWELPAAAAPAAEFAEDDRVGDRAAAWG